MALTHLPPDFKEFFRLLNSHQVRYLLVGGYAVNLHGLSRYTGDMDIWVEIDPANAKRLCSALNEFGFDESTGTDERLFLNEKALVQMGVLPYRIDILTTVSGVIFSECYPSRLTIDADGIPISLIDLDHLKTNKRASGRLKDLADVEYFEQQSEPLRLG